MRKPTPTAFPRRKLLPLLVRRAMVQESARLRIAAQQQALDELNHKLTAFEELTQHRRTAG